MRKQAKLNKNGEVGSMDIYQKSKAPKAKPAAKKPTKKS